MTEEQRSRLGGLCCGVLAGLAVLLSFPFAQMGFMDDWSYIRTAYDFARTGHFLYNGWATAMLGWQIVWSAPFLKTFGYTFSVPRLSMLPFAVGCGWLLHAILRRSGISNRNAVFGSLTFCLSPVFVPLAASYMSDVGALFVILLCMYLCQRALEAKSDRAAILWLSAATLTNVAGGTERQIVWLGALVLVPSTAWLMRKRRGVIPAAAVLWVASVVAIFFCTHWFYQQPYSVPEKLFYPPPQDASKPLATLILDRLRYGFVLVKIAFLPVVLLQALLCLLLIVLPVLIAWLVEARAFSRRAKIVLGAGALATIIVYSILTVRGAPEGWFMPWLYHVLRTEAIARKSWDMLGQRPIVLPLPVQAALSSLVVITGVAFAQWLFAVRRKPVEFEPAGKSWTTRWKTLLWLYLPYLIGYVLLLCPRGLRFYIFDRYLLGIMPVILLYLLKLYEERLGKTLPALCYVTLVVFALYGIAATHDLFALNRARVIAVNDVRSRGVPESAVQAGFEYDGWSEIDEAGYINESKMTNPPHAYHVNLADLRRPGDCRLGFDAYTPALHPKYMVVLTPMWCLEASGFQPVDFRAWLPPFSRRIYIQKVPEQMQDLEPVAGIDSLKK